MRPAVADRAASPGVQAARAAGSGRPSQELCAGGEGREAAHNTRVIVVKYMKYNSISIFVNAIFMEVKAPGSTDRACCGGLIDPWPDPPRVGRGGGLVRPRSGGRPIGTLGLRRPEDGPAARRGCPVAPDRASGRGCAGRGGCDGLLVRRASQPDHRHAAVGNSLGPACVARGARAIRQAARRPEGAVPASAPGLRSGQDGWASEGRAWEGPAGGRRRGPRALGVGPARGLAAPAAPRARIRPGGAGSASGRRRAGSLGR